MEEKELIFNCYETWKELGNNIKKLNIFRTGIKNSKQERMPNFPECVSEFIGRTIMKGVYMGKGDMFVDGKRIEIKAISSKGPTSFGPSEAWDKIIFIDLRNQEEIVVYQSNSANESKEWLDLKINKKETFGDQCKAKRRPRIGFDLIKKYIKLDIIYRSDIKTFFKNEIYFFHFDQRNENS